MRKIIIAPQKSLLFYLQEIKDYQELFFLLAWRDVLLHYKNTTLGVLWVVLRPLLTMLLFTFVMKRWLFVNNQQIPYPLIVFSGMIVWQFFVDTFTYGATIFLTNSQLISKVYFPRVFLPASRVLCSILDASIITALSLFFAWIMYGIAPTIKMLFFPFLLLWLSIFSAVTTILFALLVVHYRDFKHVIPFVVQLGFYVTPIIFNDQSVFGYTKIVLSLNPCFSMINVLRWMIYQHTFCWYSFLSGISTTMAILFLTVIYFRYFETMLVDNL